MNVKMWITMLALAALAVGCKSQQKEPRSVNEDFLPDDANRTLWRALEAQAAEGAAQDGNLYEHHFAGSQLSSQGRDKLDLMVRAEHHPLVVYVDVLDQETFAARQESVSRFLSAAGISPEGMLVKMGTNPSATSGSAPNISRMWKTESPGSVSSDSGASGGTGAGGDMDASGLSPSFR